MGLLYEALLPVDSSHMSSYSRPYGDLGETRDVDRLRARRSLTYRLELSSFTDRHLLVDACARTIRSVTFTGDPSNSSRKWQLGCMMIQTLSRFRWLLKITSHERPARAELFTQVRKSCKTHSMGILRRRDPPSLLGLEHPTA